MSISVDEIASNPQPSSSSAEEGETLDSSQREEGRRDGESSVDLFLTAIEYTTDGGKPITHLFGRDKSKQKHHVRVTGHRPHFFVKADDYRSNIENHHAVYDTERVTDETLDDEGLVKVTTYLPKQVADVRDMFEDHYEADVFYDNRFLIDQDIYTGFRVHVSEGERRDGESSVCIDSRSENPHPSRGEDGVVDFGTSASPRDATSDVSRRHEVTVENIEPCDPPSVDSRVLTTDIEVASEDGFPDAGEANWPVSTIVAHDSYTDTYVGWILKSDEWDIAEPNEFTDPSAIVQHDLPKDVRLFDDESDLLHDFHEYVADKSFDIFTGWNSNDFDYRYLVNRSKSKSVYSYQDWSELGDVWITNSRKEPVIKGATAFDMMAGYEKTQIHELDSKALEDVAADELGYGKEDVKESHTEMWKQNPVEFLKYNKVDTELVVEIEQAQEILPLYREMRKVTGAQLDDCHAPIDMLDVMFLREAAEWGYRLPTATKPEDGWFYGGYVFDMTPGIHKHCLYPDVASEYPSAITQNNVSPETIIGTEEDLEASEYTENDCVWSYVDTRADSVKKETDPEYEKLYYLKPSIKEGFVSSVVEEIMVLTEQTSGKRREALKRSRNAVWGYLGDSDSYGTGSRLFNKQMAESITLCGRRVIQKAGELFVDNVPDPQARVISGDTDSVVTTLPSAENGEQALEWGFEATEKTNDELATFCTDEFGLESVDDADMVLELEDYSKKMFMGEAKKRYATLESWNDEDGWLDTPELSVKGYEYVRSDVAQVTKDAQEYVFNAIMRHSKGKAQELVSNYVNWLHERIESGAYPSERLGRPFGIGQDLDEYGSPSRRPQPSYRGARYANEVIYEGTAIGEGDKPLLFYVNGVSGDLRSTYPDWDVAGGGDKVDAISVNDATDLPAEAHIDTDKMIQKTVKDPLSRIFTVLGWDYDEMLLDSEQKDLSNYM